MSRATEFFRLNEGVLPVTFLVVDAKKADNLLSGNGQQIKDKKREIIITKDGDVITKQGKVKIGYLDLSGIRSVQDIEKIYGLKKVKKG